MVATKKETKKAVLSKKSISVRDEKAKNGDLLKVGIVKNSDSKSAKEFLSRVARYRKLDALSKRIQNEMKDLKAYFADELKADAVDHLYIGDYKVMLVQTESLAFNSKEFEKAYKDLYEKYKTKLTVSEKVLVGLGK